MYTFTYQKALLLTLFCLFLKSSKAFRVSLKKKILMILQTPIVLSNQWCIVYMRFYCGLRQTDGLIEVKDSEFSNYKIELRNQVTQNNVILRVTIFL